MAAALDFFTINSKRAVMKVPIISLCIQAGVGIRTYYNVLNGDVEPTPPTVARLHAALARFKMAYGGDPGPLSLHAVYKLSLVLAAAQLKSDARAALTADPKRKATADPVWKEAARVRQLAYWITSNMAGFKQAEVARAAGVTKQAVHEGIKSVEDDPDPVMMAAMRHLEEVFSA
jgi:hypothetical protein